VDSVGTATAVTASNAVGTGITFPALVVAPTSVTLTGCTDRAQISIAGGRGPGTYAASSGNAAVVAQAGFDYLQISRTQSQSPPPTQVTVTISDGQSIQPVTVTLTGNALGLCPPGTP